MAQVFYYNSKLRHRQFLYDADIKKKILILFTFTSVEIPFNLKRYAVSCSGFFFAGVIFLPDLIVGDRGKIREIREN